MRLQAIALATLSWLTGMPPALEAQDPELPHADASKNAVTPLLRVEDLDALIRQCIGRFEASEGRTGRTLDLRPEGRFEFSEHGCLGASRYTGTSWWTSGSLTLQAEAEALVEDEPMQSSSRRFGPYVPVRCEDAIYLLEPDRLAEFCDAINSEGIEREDWSGRRPRRFLRREAPLGEPNAEGQLLMPADWSERVLPAPVSGRVVAFQPDGSASIDLGSVDGLRDGMQLTLHFVPNPDWAVPQGEPWYTTRLVRVREVSTHSSTIDPQLRKHAPLLGRIVTGRISTARPLPLELWRTTGRDRHLNYDPLPPLRGTSQEELERWTEQIRSTFSPGVPLEPELQAEFVDRLTPAFLNAIRGLHMGSSFDVSRVEAILSVWAGYRGQCIGERMLKLGWDPKFPPGTRDDIDDRITRIETFVMWWREMSADPQRLADFQRARKP